MFKLFFLNFHRLDSFRERLNREAITSRDLFLKNCLLHSFRQNPSSPKFPEFNDFHLYVYSKSYFSVNTNYISSLEHQGHNRLFLVVEQFWIPKVILHFALCVGILIVRKCRTIAVIFDISPTVDVIACLKVSIQSIVFGGFSD